MGIIDYLGDNSAQIDAGEYEQKVREQDPRLLQQDERVVLAFKGRGGKGRDHYMFTSSRVIIRDKKGMTGKRVKYTSVPYPSIRSFSVETCGTVDTDSELKMYARGIGKVSIDFVKSFDILSIHRFLSAVVIQGKGAGELAAEGAVVFDGHAKMSGQSTGFLDLMGSNFAQVDKNEVESRLKSGKILVEDEKVEMAFKCGRDSFILTSHRNAYVSRLLPRVLRIDVQGVTGKKVEYLSILWPAIKGYSIETTGNILDRDSELCLFFNLPDSPSSAEGFPRNSRTRLEIDFRAGQAVQRYVSDKLLGTDTGAPSAFGGIMSGKHDTGSGSILAWVGDDNRMVDPVEANQRFHTTEPILQACETVELAFKGRRDLMLFTTKRVIFVDLKGFMGVGTKVEYTSIPYTTVTAFSLRSAGSWMDKDSELCLWLDFDDVFYPRRDKEDDPPPPPIPRKSYIEIDFQKDKVDLFLIHRYLSERIMRVNGHQLKPYTSAVSPALLVPSPNAGNEKQGLLDWIGDNAVSVDTELMENKLREAGVLQDKEHLAFAFKTGRDSLFLTNMRLFVIDVQGFSGKRKEYKSVPLDVIRMWSVESAGNFDRDMELRVCFKGAWDNRIDQDLRKGSVDIFALQSFIAHFIIGDADGKVALQRAKEFEPAPAKSATKFLGYLNDAHMTDPAELTTQLRATPPILQQDESVNGAFKCGRDKFIITTKRILIVDRKGVTGKSVEYKSYPLMYNKAFSIETEGHLLNGSEVTVYTDDADLEQDLAKGEKDNIWLIHEILSNKMLTKPQQEFVNSASVVEAEIDCSGIMLG